MAFSMRSAQSVMGKLGLHVRQCPQSTGQSQHIPAVHRPSDHTGHDALQIGNILQGFFQLGPDHRRLGQFLHSPLAADNFPGIQQGLFHPASQ